MADVLSIYNKMQMKNQFVLNNLLTIEIKDPKFVLFYKKVLNVHRYYILHDYLFHLNDKLNHNKMKKTFLRFQFDVNFLKFGFLN